MTDLLEEEHRPRKRKGPNKRIRAWVEHYARRETLLAAGGSAFLVAFGAFALFLTFWICYGFLGFVAVPLLPVRVSHAGLLIGAAVMVALLFVAYWVSDREELERLEFETGPGVTTAVNVMRAVGYGHYVVAVGPKYAGSFVKVLSLICLIAPQSFGAAWKLAARARRVHALDVDGCARILELLMQAGGKVTLNELARNVSPVDWNTMLPLLREMDGVVFLFQEYPGLTVAQHLHEEIAAFESR